MSKLHETRAAIIATLQSIGLPYGTMALINELIQTDDAIIQETLEQHETLQAQAHESFREQLSKVRSTLSTNYNTFQRIENTEK